MNHDPSYFLVGSQQNRHPRAGCPPTWQSHGVSCIHTHDYACTVYLHSICDSVCATNGRILFDSVAAVPTSRPTAGSPWKRLGGSMLLIEVQRCFTSNERGWETALSIATSSLEKCGPMWWVAICPTKKAVECHYHQSANLFACWGQCSSALNILRT